MFSIYAGDISHLTTRRLLLLPPITSLKHTLWEPPPPPPPPPLPRAISGRVWDFADRGGALFFYDVSSADGGRNAQGSGLNWAGGGRRVGGGEGRGDPINSIGSGLARGLLGRT